MFDNIFIDIREQGSTIMSRFQGKSLVSLEYVLTKFEETIDELDNLAEEFKDFKRLIEEKAEE